MRMTSTRSLLKKILPWNLQVWGQQGGRRGMPVLPVIRGSFDTDTAYRCALHGRMELPPDSHVVPIPMQMPHLSDQNKIL